MKNATLRAAVPDDAAAMEEIARESSGAAEWKVEDYRRLLEEGGGGLLAEVGRRPVGFIAWRCVGDEAELLNVAVAAAERRKGVGKQLLAGMTRRLVEEGVEEVHLEVHEGNLAARRLYEAAGFGEVGRRKGYYRQPPGDAVLMRRDP